MSATEARAALPELLTRVQNGDEVTITRHGVEIAVLVRPDLLHTRRDGGAYEAAALVHDLLDEAVAAGGLSADRAEELVAAIRADRDRT